jgi:hypothetical protein
MELTPTKGRKLMKEQRRVRIRNVTKFEPVAEPAKRTVRKREVTTVYSLGKDYTKNVFLYASKSKVKVVLVSQSELDSLAGISRQK